MCGRLFAAIVALAVMLCMAPHGNSLLRPLSIRPKSKLTYPRYHVSIVHNRISADPFNEPDAESEEEDFLPPVLLPSMTDDDMEEVIDVAEPEVVAPAKGRGRKKKPSQNEITAEAVSEITTDAAAGIISTQRVLQARPPVRSWEEKYEDDPLKADVPTRDFEKPPERFEIRYFVMSKKFSSLERREELWIPHLQWARRSALAVPSEKVKAAVLSEFTLLSSDRMSPTAQVESLLSIYITRQIIEQVCYALVICRLSSLVLTTAPQRKICYSQNRCREPRKGIPLYGNLA